MNQLNTLFIRAEFGLKPNPSGIFESHMWVLNEQEKSMKFISLHKEKGKRAYKGGKIIDIRIASDTEIKDH